LTHDVTIRNVTAHDLDACYGVEVRCFPPSEAAPRERIERRIRVFPEGFFVAELDGTVIGFINGSSTDKEDITDQAFKEMANHDPCGKNIVIIALAVDPQFQKKGIARKLLSRFIEESERLEKQKVMLICKPDLVDYYRAFGFIDAGESASTYGGAKWHDMVLPLQDRCF
jgi:ribosomal protein S18 acetylase RimI-like enzyme